jgi:hypothetical protein
MWSTISISLLLAGAAIAEKVNSKKLLYKSGDEIIEVGIIGPASRALEINPRLQIDFTTTGLSQIDSTSFFVISQLNKEKIILSKFVVKYNGLEKFRKGNISKWLLESEFQGLSVEEKNHRFFVELIRQFKVKPKKMVPPILKGKE